VYQGQYHNADVAIKVLNLDLDQAVDFEVRFGRGARLPEESPSPFTAHPHDTPPLDLRRPPKNSSTPPSPQVLTRFKREVDFQRRLSYHPNVVRFIGACAEIPEALALHPQVGGQLAGSCGTPTSRVAGTCAPQLRPPILRSPALHPYPSSPASATPGCRAVRCPPCTSHACAAPPPPPPPGPHPRLQSGPIPPALARGVKLAIVMELMHLGSVFGMIAQARRWGGRPAVGMIAHGGLCLA
jgi:serine/threonine protein kinase